MKNILLLLLLIAPVYCFAQADSLKHKQKEEFCEVQFARVIGGKYVVKLDDGSESGKATLLKDASGNNRNLNL